ncbi:MAG TPA: hypothetical protein VLB76_17020 [Thermoanaerobaculia bacterium]|jgi:hypothetical protein|nr:hypothetical protein [Thermoanaerobaculia bacterium]
MSKLTFYVTLFCAAILFAVSAAPASAAEAPKTRVQRVERAAPPAADAAKIAFLQSLGQGNGKQPAKSPRRPFSNKLAREGCTSDGPTTTCCAPCGCCSWFAGDPSPRCISNC